MANDWVNCLDCNGERFGWFCITLWCPMVTSYYIGSKLKMKVAATFSVALCLIAQVCSVTQHFIRTLIPYDEFEDDYYTDPVDGKQPIMSEDEYQLAKQTRMSHIEEIYLTIITVGLLAGFSFAAITATYRMKMREQFKINGMEELLIYSVPSM